MSKLLKLTIVFVMINSHLASAYEESSKDDKNIIGLLVQAVHSAVLWKDSCSDLYTHNESKYEQAYNSSFLKKFSKLYDYDRSFRDSSVSRQEKLAQLGQTDEIAQKWCDESYFKYIENLNKKYGHRYQEIEDSFNESLKRYNKTLEENDAKNARLN